MDCSLNITDAASMSLDSSAAPVAVSAKLPTKASHLVSPAHALDTLMKLAGGYTMRAEFHVSPEGGMNSAGHYISDVSTELTDRYLDVIEALRGVIGHDYATERHRKMILASHDMDHDDALDLVMKFTSRN